MRELGMRLEFMVMSRQTCTGRLELVLLCSQLAKYQWDGCGFTAPGLSSSVWTSVITFGDLVLMLPLIPLWLHDHFCISDYLLPKRFFKSEGVSSIRESILMQMLDWLWRELGPFPSTASIASVFRHGIDSSNSSANKDEYFISWAVFVKTIWREMRLWTRLLLQWLQLK